MCEALDVNREQRRPNHGNWPVCSTLAKSPTFLNDTPLLRGHLTTMFSHDKMALVSVQRGICFQRFAGQLSARGLSAWKAIMMRRSKSIAQTQTWCTAAMIFAVALLTRLLRSDVPINVDEATWIGRGVQFFSALINNDLAHTYLRHHPGVTNMWLIGSALSLRCLLRGGSPFSELSRQSAYLLDHMSMLEVFTTVRSLFALVTAASVTGIYLLSRRLFGSAVALIGIAILLLEPFFLAYQRSITTDANQANFTWLALLAFLLYLHHAHRSDRGARRWLLISGVCYGLAVLSKIPALLSLPVLVLWALFLNANLKTRGSKLHWLRLLGDLLLWGLLAMAVIFLLWPALWVDLPGTLSSLYTGLGNELEGHFQFLLGQPTHSPGVAFYPLVLLFRLSPLLLLGTLLGLLSLLLPALRHRLPDTASLLVITLNLIIVLIALSSNATKMDRYIVPLIPGLALLAASGIWAVVSLLPETRSENRMARGRVHRCVDRRLSLSLAVVLLIQVATLLPHFPYNLTYFNPLLGGPARAQKLLMVGNGELLDQAASWLNQQPEADSELVAIWYQESFAPYYLGPAVKLLQVGNEWPWVNARYMVLYVNQFQRQRPSPQHIRYFSPQRPLHTVRAHGVDYVRIYRGPAVRPDDLEELAYRTNLDFGGSARLLGYELERPQVTAGERAVIALYWQALTPFPAPDYSVCLGVRSAEGTRFSKADSEPVGGFLPVYQWQPGQIIRDVQQVQILPGTPPGDYTLEAGFWSKLLQQALEIRDENGAHGDRIALTTVSVTRPERPPSLDTDLRIAQRTTDEASVSLGGARLIGYEWSQPTMLRAGDSVPLTLLWQASEGNAIENVQLYLQLSSDSQSWRRAHGHPLGGSYPPRRWTEGELVRDIWNALLPADAPDGRHRLHLIAETASGSIPLLHLGEIELRAHPHNFRAPQPAFTQQVELGSVARLLGYDLPTVAYARQAREIVLYWQALGEMERSYTRFVHLLTAGDQIVAQCDGVPGAGTLPTTSWISGEVLTDSVQLTLPSDLPPGHYRLAVGLYDPLTWQRLADPEGMDRILLTQTLEAR